MDSSLPLYRQFTGRFFLLVLYFILSITAGVGLYLYQTEQLVSLRTQQIPEIKKYSQRQMLLVSHERLMNTVIGSKDATDFTTDFEVLNGNLKQLSVLSRKNRRLFDQLSQRLHLQSENVIRLTDNYRRNIQLKDSVLIQLTIVADGLSALILRQSQQQNKLYQQINSDGLTDRVTAVRAKALSNIAIDVNRNRELHRLLIDSLVMFSSLNLQYDQIEFDYLQQQAGSGLQQWLLNADKAANKNNAEKTLEAQVTVLNELLFVDQNTFAKWRGQLTRIYDYRAELLRQRAELAPFLENTLILATPKENLWLKGWLAKAYITGEYYRWLVAAIFIIFTLLFVILILNIRNKLKFIGRLSTSVIAEYVENGETSDKLPTQEMRQILSDIKQLSRPKHSEADYSCLEDQQLSHTLFMSQHSGHAFWQLPVTSSLQNQFLMPLLGIDSITTHWRHIVSKADSQRIIALARKAKKMQIIQRLSLITLQEKAISLTLEYRNNIWCGSVCLRTESQQLESENSFLQQQLKKQVQTEKLNAIAYCEYVVNVLQRVVLQRQLCSLAKQNNEQAGDLFDDIASLQRLIDWCQQQKSSAQLHRDDYLLALSTVNIIDEIHTALINIMLLEVENNNTLYANFDENLNPYVVLDSVLFQAMMKGICSALLVNQQHVRLDLEFKLIDVSSSQQIVRCNVLLSELSCHDELTQTMAYLTKETATNADSKAQNVNYLQDLMLIFNLSNKESVILEQSGKFSFDISLVIAEQKSVEQIGTKNTRGKVKAHDVKLSKNNVLVISTNKNNAQRVLQSFNQTKLRIEIMQDLSLFSRQLSLIYLTKNTLDAVIISPEVYCSDYDLIVQHLKTLPEKLRPKIMVIQPFGDSSIARVGLFSQCNLPWYEDGLVNSLAALLASKNKDNLLVSSDIFGRSRFLSTKAEVLLAVTRPRTHQVMIQLLHWLGLQVTLVSQPKSLEQDWQSGQYLVVISEFLSFNLEILDDIACTRGVFFLDNESKIQQEFLASLAVNKTWKKGVIPPALDVHALIEVLSPWLIPVPLGHDKGPPDTQVTKTAQLITHTELEANNPSLKSATDAISSGQNVVEIEQSLDFAKDCQPQSLAAPALCDLTRFAKNQGSTALAALMLDEYVMDIQQQLSVLEVQIVQGNEPLVLLCLHRIIHLADVIATEPLSVQCKEIVTNINMRNVNLDDVSLLHQDEHLQRQIMQLKLFHAQLSEFAESI